VLGEWGFEGKIATGRGLSVLFSGPPGTGKTMAAGVIANQLDLDLYRIDLSQVVSKYIGETEKNLSRIFAEAETSNTVLLFDEADALFGKRTEISDAHDRYANIETSYLLQRMEEYRGLAVLATNRKASLDSAFLRRLRFLLDFPFPDRDARRRLWEIAFPAEAPRDGLDLDALAGLELTGASIHAVALNAARGARRPGGAPVRPRRVQVGRVRVRGLAEAPPPAELGARVETELARTIGDRPGDPRAAVVAAVGNSIGAPVREAGGR
jgi:SpoVK/Ycf46/Vps4 family AAA+-type ATPase